MRTLALAGFLITGVASFAYSEADVSITQYDTQDPVTLDSTISYAIVVMNSGPGPSGNIVLSDTLPANVTFLSTSVPDDWSCTSPQQDTTGSLNCTNAGMKAGQSAAITLMVKPTAAGVVTNIVTTKSTEPDPNPDNNSTSEQTTVMAAQPPSQNSSSPFRDAFLARSVWPHPLQFYR